MHHVLSSEVWYVWKWYSILIFVFEFECDDLFEMSEHLWDNTASWFFSSIVLVDTVDKFMTVLSMSSSLTIFNKFHIDTVS